MPISSTGTQENGILRSIFDKVPRPLLSSLLAPEPMKLNHTQKKFLAENSSFAIAIEQNRFVFFF
jgi:hypothetical protein